MKNIKTLLKSIILFAGIFLITCSGEKPRTLTIISTTDVHGVLFPYDFIEKKETRQSLANVSSFLKQARTKGNSVLLLDNGDNLQGQPPVYYYNFIDTASEHINAAVMNYMKYDAGTVGNHDIEAGHAVYDKLVKEYEFPLLAANAIEKKTGRPYFNPYVIIEKNGLKIAVMGLITPQVPTWLPPELYSGIEFKDMVETARQWMPVILKRKPDLIIGLFHSGWEESDNPSEIDGSHNERGSGTIARNVPGFDIIICGHNHNLENKKIVNSEGDSVLILEGGSRAEYIAVAKVDFNSKRRGLKKSLSVRGELIKSESIDPDPDYIKEFTPQEETVRRYVDKKIADSEITFSTRDAYFGSSAFVDMIHEVQLEITDADISFAAPLSFDVRINEGPVTVSDMFKLYRFENMLYTMTLTGNEIKKYLEYSYSEWLNNMKGPGDHLLKFRLSENGDPVLTNGKAWLKNQPYNFDSAAGIDYVVDVSKPKGEMISIKSLSGGKKFDLDKTYRVAVNSYRGNGGGGHLAEGAGIRKEDLVARLIKSTDRDLRYYILTYLEKKKSIHPLPINNWEIVPKEWVRIAKPRDYELLFGK